MELSLLPTYLYNEKRLTSKYQISIWDRSQPSIINGDVNKDAYVNYFFDDIDSRDAFLNNIIRLIENAGGVISVPAIGQHPLFHSLNVSHSANSTRWSITIYR